MMEFCLDVYICSLGGVTFIGPAFLATALLSGFLFQSVKSEVRKDLWNRADSAEMSRPRAALLVLDHLIHAAGEGSEVYGNAWDSSVSPRINNFHTFAIIVDGTPWLVPYWDGASYVELITKPIPRIIWPEKPRSDLGNRWAKPYGLLDYGDYGTSFNLPWIVEAYGNFGSPGVLAVSALVGFLFGFLYQKLLKQAGRDCAAFAFGLGLSGTLWFGENYFAMTWGGLLTQGLALYFIYYAAGIRRIRRPNVRNQVEPTLPRIEPARQNPFLLSEECKIPK